MQSFLQSPWITSDFEHGLASVIIPTYNRASLLPATLDSVLHQNYRPLEVVVVDDGSSDDTPQVMERWMVQHGGGQGLRVSYLRQPNRGAPSARNLGLIESRGEFIQFLDSDDLLDTRKIELCADALRADPRVDLAYGPTRLLGGVDHVGYPGLQTDHPREVLEAACLRSVWTIMGPLYRRKLCVDAGPWLEELSCWQDREYNLRILSRLPTIKFVPEAISFYRIGHGPSIGDDWARNERDLRSIWQGAEAASRAIEDGCGLTLLMRERLARQFVNVGRLLGQIGESQSGQTALRRAEEVAHGSSYARTVATLRLITGVVGFRLTNRCLALRARLRARVARAMV